MINFIFIPTNVGHAQVDCFETVSCGGRVVASNTSVDECCLVETEGLAFRATAGSLVCTACTGMYYRNTKERQK